jgi:hypothetical protein
VTISKIEGVESSRMITDVFARVPDGDYILTVAGESSNSPSGVVGSPEFQEKEGLRRRSPFLPRSMPRTDVEVTTTIRQAEVSAAKTMLDRTAEQFEVA